MIGGRKRGFLGRGKVERWLECVREGGRVCSVARRDYRF